MKHLISICLLAVIVTASWAQDKPPAQAKWGGKFEQLDQMLPTPNSYRSSSGAPGAEYWQQRADYVINVELNDDNQSLTAAETITYYNNAPEELKYLWLQLDQNLFNKQSRGAARLPVDSRSRYGDAKSAFNGGYKINAVKLNDLENRNYVITDTRMQIRLPTGKCKLN